MIYADIETRSDPVELNKENEEKNTKKLNELRPLWIGYFIKFQDGVIEKHQALQKFESVQIFDAQNPLEDFFIKLKEDCYEIKSIVRTDHPLVWDSELEAKFQAETNCGICKRPYDLRLDNHMNWHKVRHHSHLLGDYISSAHQLCNLRVRLNSKVPLFFHNGGRFDQILINQLFADPLFQAKKIVDVKSISLLPKSYEHFLCQSFKWCCEICEILKEERSQEGKSTPFCTHSFPIQILDTYNYLGASLSKMVEELKKSCQNFQEETIEFKPLYEWIQKKYPHDDEAKKKSYFQALTQKQFFPYNLLSNLSRLEDKKLPERHEWYDSLRQEYSSEADITYAKEVFELFKCQNISSYLKIYLEADIGKIDYNKIEGVNGLFICLNMRYKFPFYHFSVLLCCVLESWRKLLKKHYSLDLANFVSLREHTPLGLM